MKVDPPARIPANTVGLSLGRSVFPSTVGDGGEGFQRVFFANELTLHLG